MFSDSSVITIWHWAGSVCLCASFTRGKGQLSLNCQACSSDQILLKRWQGLGRQGWFVFRGSRAVLLSSKLVTSAWTRILMRLLLLYIIYSVLLFQGQMSKDFVVGFFYRETALACRIISVKWRMEIEARRARRRADRKISNIANNKAKCPDDLFSFFHWCLLTTAKYQKRR